jgi:cytosine/uracil/thiamine/allantoin permease
LFRSPLSFLYNEICVLQMLYFTVKKKTKTLFYFFFFFFCVFFLVTHGFYKIQKTADTTAKVVWAPGIEYMALMEWASAKIFRQETIKKERQQEKKENEN